MKNSLLLPFLLLSIFSYAQTLETFAGTGISGFVNGPSELAQFYEPEQMTMDQEGNIYICDLSNHVIRKIDTDGIVTTFAGSGIPGDQLGPKAAAQFNSPVGITMDTAGNLYVVDKDNQKIKVIRSNGMVEWIAGSGATGFSDGPADIAMFNFPTHICIDEFNNLYIAGNNDNRIRKIDLSTQMVSTFAGSDNQGYQDGVGTDAWFALPQGIAIDKDNNLYVGDRNNNRIRKITPDRVVTTLAGYGIPQHMDGAADEALFFEPKGVTVDDEGNVYVADRLNYVVRKIDTEGMVTTIAGYPGLPGYTDGDVSGANLIGRAVDVLWHKDGFLLISDWANHAIRKLSPAPISTAIHEQPFPADNVISLSPNPTSGTINISNWDATEKSLVVYNEMGQVIRSLSTDNNQFNVSDLSPGLYFISISTGKQTITRKIVKVD